jgi:membrane protein
VRHYRVGALLKKTAKGALSHGAMDRAAVLAYCAVFSIAPLLVIITFVVGLIHKGDTLEQVRQQFADFVSPEAAEVIARGVVHAGVARGKGIGYAILAVVILVVGASAFTYELQRAVDVMWSGRPRSRPLFRFLARRLWTLILGVGAGVFLQISVVVNSETAAYREYVNRLLPSVQPIWRLVDSGVSFAVIVTLYLLCYKLLPRAKVAWRDALAGALFAAILFGVGRWVVGLYGFQAGFTSIYGAAGSLMILLAWLYYTSLVFLFGARFTRTCGEEND